MPAKTTIKKSEKSKEVANKPRRDTVNPPQMKFAGTGRLIEKNRKQLLEYHKARFLGRQTRKDLSHYKTAQKTLEYRLAFKLNSSEEGKMAFVIPMDPSPSSEWSKTAALWEQYWVYRCEVFFYHRSTSPAYPISIVVDDDDSPITFAASLNSFKFSSSRIWSSDRPALDGYNPGCNDPLSVYNTFQQGVTQFRPTTGVKPAQFIKICAEDCPSDANCGVLVLTMHVVLLGKRYDPEDDLSPDEAIVKGHVVEADGVHPEVGHNPVGFLNGRVEEAFNHLNVAVSDEERSPRDGSQSDVDLTHEEPVHDYDRGKEIGLQQKGFGSDLQIIEDYLRSPLAG